MATFSIEAEDFTFLSAEQAKALASSTDSSNDTFVEYEIDRTTLGRSAELIRIVGASSDGAKASISKEFDQDSGIYAITVNYRDENDGEANASLVIGDNDPLTWIFDKNPQGRAKNIAIDETFTDVAIRQGDDIILTGQRDNGEFARIDNLEFTAVVTGDLSFPTAAASVGEGDGVAEFKVTRSNASVGDTRAMLVISGTATDGSDYTAATTEVFFAEGESEKTVTIDLVDDDEVEGAETLTVMLEAIANESVIGAQDTFTLTIEDNDEPPILPTPSPAPPIPTPVTPETPVILLVPSVSTPSPTPDTTSDNTSLPNSNPTQATTGNTPAPISAPETSDDPVSPDPASDPNGGTDDTPITTVAGEMMDEMEIEDAIGSDIVIQATRQADNLRGTDVADVINLLQGNDVLRTGLGDDKVKGRNGRDRIDTGAGNDQVQGGKHRDFITAGAGDDFANGGRGGDTINGGTGNDVLLGIRGRDVLFGGVGDDILNGGRARDQLDGGEGNDRLDGGSGSDTLSGGAGADIFVLSLWLGRDTITDFEVGRDRLQLNNDLTFADLVIQSVDSGTRISTLTGNTLATLEGVDAGLITENAFV
ncbi:MAG: hypothetical protein F6K30_05955 [Cyanothece sp. SIO2G6]|nr:hypothetical protein [Cyanothece sp. SIO2G6]